MKRKLWSVFINGIGTGMGFAILPNAGVVGILVILLNALLFVQMLLSSDWEDK
jgi:hypothetical protein